MRTLSYAAAVTAAFILPAVANATVLPPGSGGFLPDVFPACPGCNHTGAFEGGPSTASSNGVVLTLDISEAEYSDPSNPFGAGKLDFVYQFTNESSSTASVDRFTATNFAGFRTDVGYTATGASLPVWGGPVLNPSLGILFVNGSVAPGLVDRNTASTVGFGFAVPPGETSFALIIQTDATQYTPNAEVTVFFDGGAITVDGVSGPKVTTAVPEPATLSLFGLGLIGLGLSRRKLAH
jgi:hypothetical protein